MPINYAHVEGLYDIPPSALQEGVTSPELPLLPNDVLTAYPEIRQLPPELQINLAWALEGQASSLGEATDWVHGINP